MSNWNHGGASSASQILMNGCMLSCIGETKGGHVISRTVSFFGSPKYQLQLTYLFLYILNFSFSCYRSKLNIYDDVVERVT
ncbi:hypothetical protein HanRHA438_Chr04g0188161 [Helianthus annuus]|nr:hypothetical protein HanRHA438_Chr04g0188161 [Helianthus annuus]